MVSLTTLLIKFVFIFPQGKEVSVLEVLELQARKRAILSQLALEPVTKIELDSDNDSADSSSPKVLQVATSAIASTSNNKDQSGKAVVQETNGMQIIKPNVPKVKPVRLKRNFRQRQNDDYDPDEDDETKSIENSESKEVDKKTVEEKDENAPNDVELNEKKRDEIERSPSPDLIPIIQEPETYCISSDSDEGSSSVPKYITYPTVVRENLPETEDEKFLKKIKEGSGVDLRDLIKARRGGKHVDNSDTVKDTSNVTTQNSMDIFAPQEETEILNDAAPVVHSAQQLDKDTEPEEGELTDGDDQEEIEPNQITILSSDDEGDDKDNKRNNGIETRVDNDSKNIEDESESESSSSDSDTDRSDAPTFKEADDDDDIIDLGKDEELDFEMKEVEQVNLKNRKIKKTKKKTKVLNQSIDALVETTEDLTSKETNDNENAGDKVEVTESTDNIDVSKEAECTAASEAASAVVATEVVAEVAGEVVEDLSEVI